MQKVVCILVKSSILKLHLVCHGIPSIPVSHAAESLVAICFTYDRMAIKLSLVKLLQINSYLVITLCHCKYFLCSATKLHLLTRFSIMDTGSLLDDEVTGFVSEILGKIDFTHNYMYH